MRRPFLSGPSIALLAVLLAACGGSSSPDRKKGGGRLPPSAPVPPPPAPPAGGTELDAMRALWEAQGLTHYRYTLQRSSFAPPELTDPVVVEVRDGAVISRRYEKDGRPVNPAYAAWWPSVDGLFEILADAAARHAAEIRAAYDPERGYPTFAYIDHDPGLADEEVGFTARDLVPLP